MSLLVVIFIFCNSIGQQFRADGILFPPLRQALSVTCHTNCNSLVVKRRRQEPTETNLKNGVATQKYYCFNSAIVF